MKRDSGYKRVRAHAGRLLTLSAIALAVLLAGAGTAQAQFVTNPCSCYYDFECKATGRGDYCSYVGDCQGGNGCDCIVKPDVLLPAVSPFDQQFPNGVLICAGPAFQPKCDGVCRFNKAGGATYANAKPERVIRATQLVLDAYYKAGSEFGGFPDPGLLDKARIVASSLTHDWQKEILNAVHDIMLTLFGGDFLPPVGEKKFGQIPQLDDAKLLLFGMVKDALLESMRTGDPSYVKNAIYDFFAQNDVHVAHPDHCYQHGHTQAQSVEDCMAGQIGGLVVVLSDGIETPCDPESPGCAPLCDESDPNDPDCGGEPTCDPNDPDCGGGGGEPTCDPSDPECDSGRTCDPETGNCDSLQGPYREAGVNAVSRRTGKVLDGRRSRRVPWTQDPGGRSRDKD